MKSASVLLVMTLLFLGTSFSGCIDSSQTNSSSNGQHLKTIWQVSTHNYSLNYSEIVTIQKESVERQLRDEGYTIASTTTDYDFYLQAVLRNQSSNNIAILVDLYAHNKNGSTIAKYDMVFDPREYNGSIYKQYQEMDVVGFVVKKSFEFAKICNITMNFNGDYWSVSYIEDYD